MKPLYNKEKKKIVSPSLPPSSVLGQRPQGAYSCTFPKNHHPGTRALWSGQPAEVRQRQKTALIALISKTRKCQECPFSSKTLQKLRLHNFIFCPCPVWFLPPKTRTETRAFTVLNNHLWQFLVLQKALTSFSLRALKSVDSSRSGAVQFTCVSVAAKWVKAVTKVWERSPQNGSI